MERPIGPAARAVEAGVNLIDTADAYGGGRSEESYPEPGGGVNESAARRQPRTGGCRGASPAPPAPRAARLRARRRGRQRGGGEVVGTDPVGRCVVNVGSVPVWPRGSTL